MPEDIWKLIKSYLFKNKYQKNYDKFLKNFKESIYTSNFFDKVCFYSYKYKNKYYSIYPFQEDKQYCNWSLINQLNFLKYISKNNLSIFEVKSFLF